MLAKIVAQIKYLIGHMGTFFMLTVLLLSLLSGDERVFDPSYYGVAVLFSFLLSLCGYILKMSFIKSGFIRAVLHVLFATVSFVVSFAWVSGVISGSTAFVGAVVFMLLDILAMVIYFVYVSLTNRSKSERCAEKPEE